MARTAITVTTLAGNTATAFPAGTDIDATNSHVFTPVGPLHKHLVIVTNTTSSTKAATILKGDSPPADAKGQGDLSVSLTDGSSTPTQKIVALGGARFLQDDGTVNIDIAAGMTGKIAVIYMPKGI